MHSDHSYLNNPEAIDMFDKPLLFLNTMGLFPKMSILKGITSEKRLKVICPQ